ncbi:hypothetical protein GCM10007856_24180 [Azospirillum oryzae]|nr:hypothetical protein GCM10007856_24180 [Azospirillum oryzae]
MPDRELATLRKAADSVMAVLHGRWDGGTAIAEMGARRTGGYGQGWDMGVGRCRLANAPT